MIMTETSIDTKCMYVVMIGLTIAPLLKSRFTVSESYSSQVTGSTLAFTLGRLCTDAPFAASFSNHTSWCSSVVYCWCIWHRSVWNIRSVLSLRGIVSADKVSQLSVNDDVRVKIVPSVVGVSLFPVGWY